MTAQSQHQRSNPFLQRNVLLGMGSTQSSAQKAAAAGDVPNGNDDARAAKRRRVETGKKETPAHILTDQLFYAREVSDAEKSLHVQIHRILHRGSTRVSAALPREDVVTSQAQCRIRLWALTKSGETDLHCDSQLCKIKSYKDPGGPLRMAQVCLQRPFYIPRSKMCINRDDDDDSFDLADNYRLGIELQAAGPTDWPPIVLGTSAQEMSPSKKAEARRWVLQAATSDLYARKATRLSLKARKTPSSTLLSQTDHTIEVDVRFETAFEASAIRPLEEGVTPSITVHPDVYESPPGTPVKELNGGLETPVKALNNGVGTPVKQLKNGLVNGDAHEDDEAEEEITPNRSLRVRGNKTYNLKVLSDKAQGKEKKRRKRQNANAFEEVRGSVTYVLPSERVRLDCFRCVACGMPHGNLSQLHDHLVNQHAEYQYLPRSNGNGAEFEVSHRCEVYTFGAEPFSLRRPMKAFALDQFAEGNILQSRLGPEDKSTALQSRGRSRQSTVKPQTNSKLLIPDIKQTLYDPITRATLEPGTEYKKPVANDQWLIQWHRDALADFSDVPPDEREYMQEWDKFMLTKRISSNTYFPRAWLNFVKLKTEWLLSSQNRMIEFGKHLTYLLARSSLDHGTAQEAMEYIGACRTKLGLTNGDAGLPAAPKESPQGPHVRKSAGGCQVCGLTVLGPRLLLCANIECAKRLYHSDCISENAKMSVEDPDWVCNKCFDAAPAEQT